VTEEVLVQDARIVRNARVAALPIAPARFGASRSIAFDDVVGVVPIARLAMHIPIPRHYRNASW